MRLVKIISFNTVTSFFKKIKYLIYSTTNLHSSKSRRIILEFAMNKALINTRIAQAYNNESIGLSWSIIIRRTIAVIPIYIK